MKPQETAFLVFVGLRGAIAFARNRRNGLEPTVRRQLPQPAHPALAPRRQVGQLGWPDLQPQPQPQPQPSPQSHPPAPNPNRDRAVAKSVNSAHRRTIVAATSAVVIFTTFVLGGLTRWMLNVLGMIQPSGGPHSGVVDRPTDGGSLARRWQRFDARVLQPLFGGPATASGWLERALPESDRGRGSKEEVAEMMGDGLELDEASS